MYVRRIIMNEPLEFKKRIIEGVSVLPETADLYKYENYNQFWVLEGEDLSTLTDVKFLIYNCSEDGLDFNKNEFSAVVKAESEKSFFSLVMVFKELDEESKIRDKINKDLKNTEAGEKKFFNKCFDEKIGIYTNRPDQVEIEVEQDGINFLEYETDAENNEKVKGYLNGYIYNVSYQELKNIFNVTGRKLFCENVRVGLSNNKIGKKLGKAFKDYVKVGMYLELMKENEYKNYDEIIKEELELSEDEKIFKMKAPDKFWFYHNGVTIFSFDDVKVDRSNNRIKLNPNKISIINGAQTITNFYNEVNELRSDFININQNLNISSKYGNEWLDDCLENVCKKIKIKTIIIDGLKEFVREISKGLNTQIPIQEETILAISSDVEEINKVLKSQGISINRDGEVSAEINLSVLEFVKKYLIIKGNPGTSKNFDKKQLESYLSESSEKCLEKSFINKLKVLIELDEWWKGTRNPDNFLSKENKDDVEYFKYGKNYFGSYLITKEIMEVDEENLYNLFNQFVKEFKRLKQKVTLEDFKNDNLYNIFSNKIKSQTEIINKKDNLNAINTGDLGKYLNENLKSRYTVAKIISNYLDAKDIIIPYFRVIAIKGEEIKEAYPFPRRTFTELYQSKKENEDVTKIEFEDSEFYKEIKKVFPVFVIIWNAEGSSNEINDVRLLDDFSFKEYEQEAKQVFNETKEAFIKGDYSLFVKSSAGKKFHIRPKAINSEDTFEFSNGMQITKRTFWANKDTIREIIEKYNKKDFK